MAVIDVSPVIEYTVRRAVETDRRFIVETTARVRQPRNVSWFEWEPYGMCWAERVLDGDGRPHPGYKGAAWVVEAKGVLLGFVLLPEPGQPTAGVEMIYCKREFRGLGLGRLLLDAAGFEDELPCRAPTDSLKMWCRRRGIRWTVVE